MSNCLDPDQDQHFVGPDLGPNYLQRLSADDKSHPSMEIKCMQLRWALLVLASLKEKAQSSDPFPTFLAKRTQDKNFESVAHWSRLEK